MGVGASAAAAAAAASAAGAAADSPSASAAALHETLHARGVRGPGTIVVPIRCKAVLLEDCADTTLRLPAGTLATLELLRCRRVEVEIGAAVSCVRVDESEDVAITFRGSVTAEAVSVFSTGSRKVRVAAQRHPAGAGGAAEFASLLPETFHTKLVAGADAFVHAVVDSTNPWGVA